MADELAVNEVDPTPCNDYTNKIVVLRKSSLIEPFASMDRRMYVTGGFGAKAYTIGTAVFGILLLDGEDDARWRRGDIAGLAKDQTHTKILDEVLGR